MTFRIYDTMTRGLVEFQPKDPGVVRMYNCGPTVYSSPTIGNFRSFLMADLLRRHLEARGFTVHQVMNITDVGHLTEDDIEQGEDKLVAAARRERVDPFEIARRYEKEFFEALEILHFRKAEEYPRATEHIAEMIEMIQGLLDKGHAYRVGGNVYFDEESFAGFGKLSHKNLDELLEGARVAVNEEKKDPRDFALWKTDEKHLMQWDAPWGRGFPGWHIECSAMSRKYLGDELDIHTGGEDNIFPHHECEIAQSESFTGKKPFVRYWVHCRHLLVEGKKMSKSLGNYYTIQDLVREGWTGREIRVALGRVHYRQPVNFTKESLAEARKGLQRIHEARARLLRIAKGLEEAGEEALGPRLENAREEFGKALDEDLNISAAMAVLFELVSLVNRSKPSRRGAEEALALFRAFEDWTGMVGEEPEVQSDEEGFVWMADAEDPKRSEVLGLAKERAMAKAKKDYQRADEIRDQLARMGYRLVDTAEGIRIEKV
ncbi:MAG TPA: cysteine--tRNA ligase [Planctomycetes bacterium]|nr:cysteine--tRNA ligase [Planctomycetota bacterium]